MRPRGSRWSEGNTQADFPRNKRTPRLCKRLAQTLGAVWRETGHGSSQGSGGLRERGWRVRTGGGGREGGLDVVGQAHAVPAQEHTHCYPPPGTPRDARCHVYTDKHEK